MCLMMNCYGHAQKDSQRSYISEAQAKKYVNEALKDATLHNVIGSNFILKTKEQAIAFAEMILFDKYGKKNIEGQKPYAIFQIDSYWLLQGTMLQGMKGGIFSIIIDARNCKIIRLTHGK